MNKNHYVLGKYGKAPRFSSYYYQLKSAVDLNPKNIIEIGVGDKVFGQYIVNNTDIEYKSMDIDRSLNPDIVGDILNIPESANSF